MMITTMDATRDMLAAMMVEPTGTSILDSGGVYGRQWQRNAGMTRADFDARPTAHWLWGYPMLDVYHYLAERLEFSPVWEARFAEFADAPEREREPWMGIMDEFADEWADSGSVRGGNSYNDETFLSGVFQWTEFDHDGEHVILLQIHGGADVRGGYTRPRAFTASSDWWYCQVDEVEVYCTGERDDDEHHSWWVRSDEVISWEGSATDELDGVFGQDEPVCPRCGAVLAVAAPYPYD